MIASMKRLFYLVAALIYIAISLSVNAREIRYINMRDGLSSRQVYELEEDSDGYIWMYTNSGLERYDGYRFRHYSLDDSEESNDHIASATTMQVGPDGEVWIASKSGTIYSYDRSLDQYIKRVSFNNPHINIYHFAILPDGRIVIGTNNGVFTARADGMPQPVGPEGVLIHYVLPHNDRIYAGTREGVYSIGLNRQNDIALVPGTEGIHVKSLAVAANRLYVGPFSSNVFSIDLNNNVKRRLPFHIPPMPVNAMTHNGADTLLLGVDGAGIYIIDANDGRLLKHLRDGDNTEVELSGSTVSDVLIDKDGGTWISTSHSGVNYIPPYESTLTVIKPERGNPNSLMSGHVNAVYEDSFGERWFGTDKGVSRYNPATGKWRHYLHNHDYSANVILSIGEDADGNIWVGSYGEGASCINRNTHEVKHLPVLAEDGKRGVGTRYIFTSFCDDLGNVWFGGINGLTTKYNIKNDSYEYYDEDCISLAMAGRNHHVILGGNKGAGSYYPDEDKVHWHTQFDSISIQYPVRSMLVDTLNSEVWLGTLGEGLILYNYNTNKARRYTTADGLSSNTIYSIMRDKLGGTWVCTENDIYRYNPETAGLSRFTNFAHSNKDFDRISFNPGGYVGSNGDVIFASPEGSIIFNPNKEAEKVTSSRMILTNLILNGSSVTPGKKNSPLKTNIDLTDKLILDHKNNNIGIDFAIINFPSPNRVDYEYMLEGYDKTFRKADASRRALFTALDPGNYNFILRAIDLYSDTIISERHLPVIIRSPWWQSWWAKVIYAVIGVAFVVLGIGYINNRRRELRIENQIQTFATIAHDIRTPMSMIKAPLISVDQEEGLSEQGRRNLILARAGIDKTLGILTSMLEIPGGKIGVEKLNLKWCDIRKFVNDKCLEFRPLAMLKNLELIQHIDNDVPELIPVDIEKLNHVVDNLVANAIKYTFSGSVTISVNLQNKKRWCISVADTGIGIPKEESHRIFNYRHRGSNAEDKNIPGTGMGLLITNRLVRQQLGKISFVSSGDKGTVFNVSLPLAYSKGMPLPLAQQPTTAPDVESEDPNAANNPNRIFAIDDDADMLSFLSQTLSSDYDVVTFSEPAELLDRIKVESPAMVIADVAMPKMRGDELCRTIKTDISTSHIPVILLSGLTDRQDVVSGLEAQADDYIAKPFDLIVLKARIRNIIANRQRLNRQVLAEDSKPEDADYTTELDRQFMVKIMDILNEKIADSELSVGDICSELGMSRTSVYNKIRSITGQSVVDLIRIVRLNKAKELLATGQHNISEVAYMVGFSDPKYFSTCFKKQFGVSPSNFRP